MEQPLPGRTLADDERILLARVGFLRALADDPRLDAFFVELDAQTGLLAAADRFVPLATAVAARAGLAHRSDLCLGPPADIARAIDAVPLTADYEALVQETIAARSAATRAYTNLDAPIVAAELEVFVRALGLPWRWLAIELAEQYCGLFLSRLIGRHLQPERSLLLAPSPSLQPQPGEDLVSAYMRGTAAIAAAVDHYATAQRRAKQAGPKSDGRHLERYATWFYRLQVKQPADSIRRIAHDHATDPSNIRRGIAKVAPLLDLPSERFAPG